MLKWIKKLLSESTQKRQIATYQIKWQYGCNLFIVGRQLPANETNDECKSFRSTSLLSDSSSYDENNLQTKCCSPEMESSRLRTPTQQSDEKCFEIEAVGIGSVVYFLPVENTIYAKGRPLPQMSTNAKKGPHPSWSYELLKDVREKPAQMLQKPTTPRPLSTIKESIKGPNKRNWERFFR